jgi:hypothetical protein
MRTGEGKTLVATLPSYLNALEGKGVHIVTVNDYLAKRDAEWMGRIHRFLGLTVGVVVPQMDPAEKQQSYQADITYGTNNEFGFDYLRDNMATQVADRFQRKLHYAIVDEVDSILIDEARTPLIISGQAEDSTELYRRINLLIPALIAQKDEKGEGDYWVDLKQNTVTLSEQGHEHAEELMSQAGLLPEGASLYDPSNIVLMHHLHAGIRAHALYHRDQHYVVQDDEVIIVDEFTGRMMQGRRWSDGLHQAVEAEGRRLDQEREPDARLDHLPELFPPVQEARRHDRHGRHRGVRVFLDLQPRDGADPHAPPDGAHGRQRPGLHHRQGKVPGDHQRREGKVRARPAGAARHDVDRELRADLGAAATRKACRTRCSTRSSIAREAEDRGPGGAGRRWSPSRPTWRAVERTSCSAATPSRISRR